MGGSLVAVQYLMTAPTSQKENVRIERPGRTCCMALGGTKQMLTDKNVHALLIIVVVNLSNILLVTVKGLCAYATGSFSIANSTIESFGDVFVGALILITRLQAKCCVSGDKYPRGRTTESLSNVVASVVMIVLACINGVISIDNFIADLFDPILKNEHLYVIGFNIALKIVLFLICKLRSDVEQISVLAKDQRTDVLTNSVTFIFALATRYWNKYFDLVGAFIIFITICMNWTPILFSNCNKISGIQAQPWRVKIVEEIIESSSSLDVVHDLIVYHSGEQCVVEIFASTKSSKISEIRKKLTNTLLDIEWIRSAHVFLNQSPEAQGSEERQTRKRNSDSIRSNGEERSTLLPVEIV